MWKAACDLPPLITVGFPIEHYYRIDGGGLLKEAKWVFHHDLCGPKLKAINLSARQKTPDKKFTYVHLAKIHWSNVPFLSEPINNGHSLRVMKRFWIEVIRLKRSSKSIIQQILATQKFSQFYSRQQLLSCDDTNDKRAPINAYLRICNT